MKILKYVILTLALLNTPTFSLEYIGATVGSATNLLLSASVLIYFFISEKTKPAFPFIVLGIVFFSFTAFQYSGDTAEFIKDALRYFVFIVCANEVSKNTSTKELLIFLIIGAISIAVNAIVFPDAFGRYSGFYINPNKAGFICLFGFALSYIIKDYKFKLAIQFVCIICGIFTLSRSFILFLVLINLLSLFANKKNVQTLAVGAGALVIILTASTLQLNKDRFAALHSLFGNNDEIATQTITEGSRDETWAYFSEIITNNLIMGSGYKTMRGGSNLVSIGYGVHNTFLMALGEAGILAFLILLLIYSSISIQSFRIFKEHQEYLYLTVALIGYLMVSHNFFEKYDVLFISIWLYNKLQEDELLTSDLKTD
ncbi:O-antigen ligase family protein [Bizionia sp. KMM 8389]